MGWDEVPVAPTVTMNCPGATVYGEPPTVTATVNQSATIVFYLDGTQVSSSSGTSASYTPGTGVSVGTHAIQVVASNANGSDSVTCSWVVNPSAPTVTMECPGATVYGTPPTLTANIDQSATIAFYLDGTQVSSGSGTSVSYTPGTSVSVGTHTIEVIASNTNGTDNVSCSWIVLEQLSVTLSCPGEPDPQGTIKQFSASTNKSATITFFVNGQEHTEIFENTQSATIERVQCDGGQTISVLASTPLERDAKSCYWACSSISLAPTITLVSPSNSLVIDPTSTERTFIASVNPPMPLSFTIDGEPANAVIISDTEASVSCIQCSVGHHIQVSAENQAGKDVKFWNWMAMTVPLFVTKVDPVEQLVLDYENTRRFFTVSINRPANVQFYCDGLPYGPVFSNVTEASMPFVQGQNGHNILVNAFDGTIHGSVCWEWAVKKGSKICKAIADPSDLCIENRRDLAAIITATVIQLPDNACKIQIHYNISTCDCIMNTPGNLGGVYSADTSLIITVSWPQISDPNSPPSNSTTKTVNISDQLSPNGDLIIDVPFASYYDISYDVSTACTIFYIISKTKRTGTTSSLICSSRIE